MIRFRLPAIVFAGLLLVGCAAPATRVVLLPQADGRASAVTVRSNGGEELLSRPYQRATARAGAAGAPVVDEAEPARIQADNRMLFELAPPRPEHFTLYFDIGGAELTRESLATVSEAIAAAAKRDGGEILVTGHTDTVGTSEWNDWLSRRRAQEVRLLFTERGFPASRIQPIGRGERELAVPTADETDEPRNRRVTIEVR